jgi:hypothetical protein
MPGRPSDAPSGSEFVTRLDAETGHDIKRDLMIEEQVLAGNIPPFMRIVHPVTVGDRVTLYVMPDYLCVGSDEDFVRVPLNPMTAQRICDALGASMPTRKMVDVIWKACETKLDPMPWGPPYDSSMMSTDRFFRHDRRIRDQFARENGKLGCLVGGHKKDVVVSLAVEAPRDEKVAIYGWHQSNGNPIQGPGIQATAHEITYRDYAHGIRLVSLACMVDGKEAQVTDVLKSQELVSLLSDEKAGNTLNPTSNPDPFSEARYVTAPNAA